MAVALAGMGSAIGGGMISKATAALMSEQPEKFGQSLVLYMMSASQGLYGFIIAFLIFFIRLGDDLTMTQAMRCLGAGAISGIGGMVTAIHQSVAATAGVQILAKKPEHTTKGIIYSAMVETYAMFAFVISMFLIIM
jgi:V/A-type H+-transporting ATPase subunit K